MMASVPFSQVSFSGSAHNHFALGHQPVISSQPSKLHVPLPIAHREKGSVNDDVKQRISYQSDINADELSHQVGISSQSPNHLPKRNFVGTSRPGSVHSCDGYLLASETAQHQRAHYNKINALNAGVNQ